MTANEQISYLLWLYGKDETFLPKLDHNLKGLDRFIVIAMFNESCVSGLVNKSFQNYVYRLTMGISKNKDALLGLCGYYKCYSQDLIASSKQLFVFKPIRARARKVCAVYDTRDNSYVIGTLEGGFFKPKRSGIYLPKEKEDAQKLAKQLSYLRGSHLVYKKD